MACVNRENEQKEFVYFDLLIKLIWETFASNRIKSFKWKFTMKFGTRKLLKKRSYTNEILKLQEELYNITKIVPNSFQLRRIL